MYEELIKNLRENVKDGCSDCTETAPLILQAADAIEELSKQRDLAFTRLCDWCGVCSKEHRGAWGCDDIARLQEMQLPRWIPVTERLPENDDFVIVAIKDEHGDSPYVYSDFGWYFDRAECWIVDAEQRTDITHWMPLPQPPESDGE